MIMKKLIVGVFAAALLVSGCGGLTGKYGCYKEDSSGKPTSEVSRKKC